MEGEANRCRLTDNFRLWCRSKHSSQHCHTALGRWSERGREGESGQREEWKTTSNAGVGVGWGGWGGWGRGASKRDCVIIQRWQNTGLREWAQRRSFMGHEWKRTGSCWWLTEYSAIGYVILYCILLQHVNKYCFWNIGPNKLNKKKKKKMISNWSPKDTDRKLFCRSTTAQNKASVTNQHVLLLCGCIISDVRPRLSVSTSLGQKGCMLFVHRRETTDFMSLSASLTMCVSVCVCVCLCVLSKWDVSDDVFKTAKSQWMPRVMLDNPAVNSRHKYWGGKSSDLHTVRISMSHTA